MKIRVTGTRSECQYAINVLEQTMQVLQVSRPYPQTRYDPLSDLVAVYIEVIPR